MCRADLTETQVDEQALLKEEALMKIESLITPKSDIMDELSRLFELNFNSNKNTYCKANWKHYKRLSRKIDGKLERKKNNERKLYTVGAVEYGLPVPVSSRRNYNSYIIKKQMHVLNANIANI
jgi:hypothetical protein